MAMQLLFAFFVVVHTNSPKKALSWTYRTKHPAIFEGFSTFGRSCYK